MLKYLPASFVLSLFLSGASACSAAATDQLPADLDLVPRDAAAFVHIRAADLWHSGWAKDIRHLVDRAGPEAWKAFATKCPINPATLDHVTFILLTPQTLADPFPTADPEAFSVLVAVRTTRPFDRLTLIRALGPREKVYRQNLYCFNEDLWSGLALLDDRTFLLGSEDALVRFFEMSRQRNPSGPLQTALAEAARKHQATIGVNPTLLGRAKGVEFVPPPVQKLLRARCATLTVNLDQGIRVDARLDFLKEDGSEEGARGLRETLDLGRQGLAEPIKELEKVLHDPAKAAATDLPENFAALVALGFLRELDTLLKEAPIERQGLIVKGHVTHQKLESAQLMVVSLFGVYSLSRAAVGSFNFVGDRVGRPGKDPIEEHLRTLAQALDRYHAKNGRYPPPAIYDKDGRPLLSWRVALLPYLGEETLYSEFKLDEPWDSLHNKRLLKKLPKALRAPNQTGWGSARWKTVTQVFAGDNTVFPGPKGIARSDVARQAILLAHVTSDAAVYWTKPADVTYAADKPLPNLFGKFGNRIQVLLTDGTYRAIDRSVGEKDFRALIERRSGQPPAGRKQDAAGPGNLEAVWKDFVQNDDAGTRQAWQDIAALIQTPDKVVPFLKERVKPVPRPDAQRIARCLADLDSRSFKTREKATADLEALGELAAAAIEKKLADRALSLEARQRLEALVQKPKAVLSLMELRTVRAIEVLAGIGSPEARAVLADLAGGGEGTVITEQARKALAMLARQAASRENN